MNPRVVIVDDESPFREDLAAVLGLRGFDCRTAADVSTGLEIARSIRPCAILCDVAMPGGGAMALLQSLRQDDEDDIGVFIMTAYASLEVAVEGFRRGAVDYLLKPLNTEEVERKIRQFIVYKTALSELGAMRRTLNWLAEPNRLVGNSRAIVEVRELIRKVSSVPTIVLIVGETGTGKEVVSRLIHASGPWKDEPLIAVNCAALPEALFESEVFGHVRGAYTGAVADRKGLFEAARNGVLFLDEVTELSLGSQAKLLRALEEKRITPLGGTGSRAVNARILVASSKDLKRLVEEGKFRQDLYFRLSVMEIGLPPLRERREDIPTLVEHFLRKFNLELKRHVREVDLEAMQRLIAYPWPGNVRELQNVIERAVLLAPGERLDLPLLPSTVAGERPSPAAAEDLRSATRAYEREHIRHVLNASGGNKEETARRLGVDPATLYRKLNAAENP